jgi:DNA polymerase, archaea type
MMRGWILDVYPSGFGEMAVWLISENGDRIRLTDLYEPKVYISANDSADIERLASGFYSNQHIASWSFTYKYRHPTDPEKSRVLEVTLKDCRCTSGFTTEILRLGNYLRYEVHNCDLYGDRTWFFDRDVFPLAFVEVKPQKAGLKFTILDSVWSIDYKLPSLRIMKLVVQVAKQGKIAKLTDPIGTIIVTQDEKQVTFDSGNEKAKLLSLVEAISELDPDIVVTEGGDSFVFAYLAQRANVNSVLQQFMLSRDPVQFVANSKHGNTFFSYGRTFYRAPTNRLFGRVHVDCKNTFIMNESSFQGLFEVSRTCRVPLHTAARSSIGSSMASLQLYQALKDDFLVPRNKFVSEAFKSAYELLVADRGGFVYEPILGIHENVYEVDYSSMYPKLMLNNNISAETVLCKCCPDSKRRVPELNYNICEKREGIVAKSLEIIVKKRFQYKKLKQETTDPILKEIYDSRQTGLKWISVCCFGYLGYKNSKFGTVDGHIAVCAFSRDAFLKAARMAEQRGFTVIHGIVDSLWLKKENSSIEHCRNYCREVSAKIDVPLHFESRYRWIVFLSSKMHPKIGVLNRYYGVMEDGKVKVRGIEVRRGDTPRFIFDAQMDMIQALALAVSVKEFYAKIPDALAVVKEYRRRLLCGEVPVWDLVVTKRMSKQRHEYRQHVSQVIAAEQLLTEGEEVHAGTNVGFVFTDNKNKRFERRVKAEVLIEKGTRPDTKKYLLLLYDAAASLLSFAGYNKKTIYDAVRGQNCKTLSTFID